MVVKAAQMEGMTVVPEGGSLFTQDVTLIQDGNSTVELNIPLDIFYKDLVQLWGQTEVDNTRTLVVTYGGPAGDPYLRSHMNVWDHPIMMKHLPPTDIAAHTHRRVQAHESDPCEND